MAIVTNSASVHLAILGTLLLFSFLTMTMSGAYIGQSRSMGYFAWRGTEYVAISLILAQSILSIITVIIYLVFNTCGNMYKGAKNSILFELVGFTTLFISCLVGAALLSSATEEWRYNCPSNACNLGRATLAFAWISTINLAVLLTFLITWAFINKRESGDNSIFKSNIKAYNAEGRIQLYEDEEDGFPQSPGQKEEETVPSDGERDVNMAALKPVVITPSTPVERIASRPSSPSATAATADPLPMASPASTASLPLAYAATKAFAEAYPSMGTVNIAKPSKPANIAATTKHSTSTGTTSPA